MMWDVCTPNCFRTGRKNGALFFFQAEDGIRDVERSRGLGDVYKRQIVLVDVISLPQVATCGHVLSTIKTWALLINWVTC